jgi:uncharacterized membrane protein YbhN (UPF0104 family)
LTFPLFFIGGWRWYQVARLNGIPIGLTRAVRVTAESHLFNQALPATLGGDAYRVWTLRKLASTTSDAVGCVVADWIFGLITLCILAGITQWKLLSRIVGEQAQQVMWIPVAAIIGLVLLLLIVGRIFTSSKRDRISLLLHHVFSKLKTIFARPVRLLATLIVGLVGSLFIVIIFFILAQGLQIPITAVQALTMFPTVYLLSMIPVTVAGWGVREAVLISVLGFVGVGPSLSIALGISFGLVMLMASIPGGVLWLLGEDRERFELEEISHN